ncbi:MAG: sugar isomerase domain-containing protein [Mycoplasmatales bacterium]
MNLIHQFNQNVDEVINKVRTTQEMVIQQAAKVIAKTVANGGIIQAFGSGHSFAGAIEIAGRAGGFIPSKAINNFYGINGWLETIAGVGTAFIKQVDMQPEDCFIIISNSGRNPLHIEFAKYISEFGCQLIVITNKQDALKNAQQGDSILNYADVIIDNCGFSGDCSIEVQELEVKVAPTSSIAVAHIASMMILLAIEELMAKGITPPIYKSANIAGGREYNHKLREQYQQRLNRI